MKRILVAAAALSAIAAPAFAQDALNLSGSVAPVCTITAPADNNAVNLSGATTLGSLTVQCNDPQGFTASASSLNSGRLVEANNPTYYTYQLGVNGVGNQNLSSPVSFSTASLGGNAGAAAAAAVGGIPVQVSLQNVARVGSNFAGSYSDTITFSIAAN
ncbi:MULTISPECIES: hypothetical protein [Brevundimonas]|uniref:hypothetical protein n=1 Tax=Brevundimonas TaxID=41275 RepID=UPI000F01B922|nr:hypothetical protein [Brevundimonas lutea]